VIWPQSKFSYSQKKVIMALVLWFCMGGVAGIALYAWVLLSERKARQV
jgi:hypothetical protein